MGFPRGGRPSHPVHTSETKPEHRDAFIEAALLDGMPRRYSPGRKVLDLLKAGRTVSQVAFDLQISDQTIYNWREHDLIDTGRKPGLSSSDHAELVAARRRTAELETELAARRRASTVPVVIRLGFGNDDYGDAVRVVSQRVQ